MNIEWVRRYCMSLPHATETVQWGDHLVFKIGGKVFAILALEPSKVWLSVKCAPEEFVELVERPGIIQAPHLARNLWVALETEDALAAVEIKRLVRTSYDLVLQKLPKKVRSALA
ncbi:MAG TPA: MmcQ/YjbR family DNA-binding protein [Bryobacteraceae bacterium]|jgi:predicted DNA-binding protein (MmcQ/YjbR family)|nr:MmcQ/YjbR family DNA-binding protein [Bryobacteraceae bacterium]